MNILFLLKSLDVGGVEVVTCVLANKFASEGHHVVVWAFYEGNTSLAGRLDTRVKLMYGHGFHPSKENVKDLRKVLIDNNVQIIINQWGLPVVPIIVVNKAAKGLGVKVITVYHNMPNANGRVQMVDIKLAATNNPLKKCMLKLQRKAFEMVTSAAMRYNYNHSDRYMVLSPSFVDIFKRYTKIKDDSKLIVQTNPVTIADDAFIYDKCKKRKEIIYVGRIDRQQKRVDRIIETWEIVSASHPDWQLTIVGDGEGRENVESMAKSKNLPRIAFEGFRNPLEYYKRASILLLTSEYEGFGLVLIEGMKFGVVPIVFGNYPAVFDIIDNGVNGTIVMPNDSKSFDVDLMAKAVDAYMDDEALLHRTAQAAIQKSRSFSIETISRQWNDVFVNICKSGGVIRNALWLPPYCLCYKQKEIIYVGRIDYNQKRVNRVIDTWALLEPRFSDWQLTIVGDGPAREDLEKQARDLGLRHVSFEGFQSPVEYYKRASILMLTSDFEGFPLVLPECMSFGTIPVVYHSYAAVEDVIDDHKNGLVIPFHKAGYDAKEAARIISPLMKDASLRDSMAQAAMEKSTNFSIDKIYTEWMEKLTRLLENKDNKQQKIYIQRTI